ncbi:MAG: hypothetical protein HYW24_00375 [Candidatus Aenigmarchaeota archaeon]|nr:hypothetical protein [Candidatus Aenigmarchaeota archaeon]
MHKAGFEDTYLTTHAAERHARDTLYENRYLVGNADYLIVALWGDNGTKIAEVFGYGGISEWPGNPDKYCWIFHDGVYQPEKTLIACGDTDIALGREEEYRRTTRDIRKFMAFIPRLSDDLEACSY